MQALSNNQLREITQLIQDHHLAFMVNIGLGDLVDPSDVARLKKSGLISPLAKSYPTDAFLFGILADALDESKSKDLSYSEFKTWLRQQEAPVGQEERAAITHLKRSLMTHIKGLGNKLEEQVQGAIVEADKGLARRASTQVKQELVRGIEQRKAISEIVTGIQKATKDRTKDWMRIAVTELNNAFQEGKLSVIQKSNKGRDPLVFKRVRADACTECKDAYLNKNGTPRVFHLSELLSHGTNVGKSHNDRVATVQSHHPHCQCELQELPPGFTFDVTGAMVYEGLG